MEVSPTTNFADERRAEPRVRGPFHAVVLDAGGGRRGLGAPAVLEDLSACGFRLRLSRQAAPGEWLLVVAQVSQALVVLRGRVLRAGPQKEGYGLAAAVAQYKIFSLPEPEE